MNLNATTTTDKKRGEREILFSGAVIIKIFRKEKKKQFNKTKVVSQLLLLVLFLHPGGWRRAQVRERERERERAWASQREAARFSPRAPLLFVSRSGSPRVIFFFSLVKTRKNNKRKKKSLGSLSPILPRFLLLLPRCVRHSPRVRVSCTFLFYFIFIPPGPCPSLPEACQMVPGVSSSIEQQEEEEEEKKEKRLCWGPGGFHYSAT
jgi:hypothetical protein